MSRSLGSFFFFERVEGGARSTVIGLLMLLGVVDSRFNMSDHSEASKFSRTSDLCPGGSLEEQRYFF